MKVVIDRFEGSYAVCEKEDRGMIEIEIQKLPEGAMEGDVLNIENEKISIDLCETKARQKKVEELTKDIWN